jgi:peptidoglycan/xylan/chitin deacetylase (PgdA/CDA1 family)
MLTRFSSAMAAAAPTTWLTKAGRGRLLVLCYHDLCEPSDFSSWLRVEVGRFSEHLDALSQLGRFVSPAALNQPRGSNDDGLQILITFDDGYANNLRLAADVLARFGAPALFFISTHHLVTGEPFWFDRVVTRIQAAALERLDLARFGLSEYTFPQEDGPRRWTAIQRLLEDMKALGNPEEPQLRRVLGFMDAEFGETARSYEERFRPLSIGELQELARSPHTFFGSHAHHHEILPRLSQAAVTESLATSKRILETTLDREIDSLAYPNGDENRHVREVAMAVGYRRGYSARAGLWSDEDDSLSLPRLLVGGFDTAPDLVASVRTLLALQAAHDVAWRVRRGLGAL